MAFLAKKVPKIFPSKTKKGHEDLLSPDQKTKGTSLFRKLAREGGKDFHQDPAPHTPLPTPAAHGQSPIAQALDCHCHSSDDHSSASTLESSPTPTPRETKDPKTLVLPDLPKLAFPSQEGGKTPTTRRITAVPSAMRLGPRPTEEDDLPPPVALVSVPSEFSFPPPPPACGSSEDGGWAVARCLTHAPPRAGEWDDATIESDLEDCSHHDPDKSNREEAAVGSLSQQQERFQREQATAQASAIMKPWIDRAARLALLQNRVCANPPEHSTESDGMKNRTHSPQRIGTQVNFAPLVLQRRRMREAALANLRPRPEGVMSHRQLLASLEEGRSTRTSTAVASKSSNTNSSCEEHEGLAPAPRIVKWHVVRQPCK